MRRLFRAAVLSALVVVTVTFAIQFSVSAHRQAKDLASSQNGSNPIAGDCSDNSPTPFAAVLNGQVTPTDPESANPPSCTNFSGTGSYPNYSLVLVASDQSFNLTVTPVLWGGGNATSTILHLEFSSTSPTLNLQSFIVGNLTMSSQTAAEGPAYVPCDFGQASTSLYLLPVIENNQNDTFNACTQPTMEAVGAPAGSLGYANAIQPTPIQFADANTTRWDIDGLSGSSSPPTPLPSVDLFVPGVPSDLISAMSITGASTNNLTSTFMASTSNFLAVAVDSSTGKTVTAGGLAIPTVTTVLTNDSISNPMVVDPTVAMSASGFVDQVNTVGATPQENSDGTFSNPPTDPADPILSGTICFAGGPDSRIFRTVWYSFTPTEDGTVNIDTAHSRYDTVLALFTGKPGHLTLQACDDDFVDADKIPHLQARLQDIQVTHGTPYLILVGESPTQIGVLNDSSGNPTSQSVAAPLSNDATLFLSVVEDIPLQAVVPLPDAAFGSAYSQALDALGGVPPYRWQIIEGSLPSGLSLNSSTGVISGKPTTVGVSTFTAQVTDSETPPKAAEETVDLTVNKAVQRIAFPPLTTPVKYGIKPIPLSARATSGLRVEFIVDSGPAKIQGSNLVITGAGLVEVEAMQPGSSDYEPASPVLHTMVVEKPSLTVTANNLTMKQGGNVPKLTYSIAGFVGTDNASNATTGSPKLSTTATKNSTPGMYPIAVSIGSLSAKNYVFAFMDGKLTVAK